MVVEDKRVRGEVVFSPCGLNEQKEVVEADIVVGDELYHVSKGENMDCHDCVWELMEWLQGALLKNAIKTAEERAIENHKEGSVLWNERARELKKILGEIKVPLWMTMMNKEGNHQVMTNIHVWPQLVRTMLKDRAVEPMTVMFFKIPEEAKQWLLEEGNKRKNAVKRICTTCRYHKVPIDCPPCSKCGSGLPNWEGV